MAEIPAALACFAMIWRMGPEAAKGPNGTCICEQVPGGRVDGTPVAQIVRHRLSDRGQEYAACQIADVRPGISLCTGNKEGVDIGQAHRLPIVFTGLRQVILESADAVQPRLHGRLRGYPDAGADSRRTRQAKALLAAWPDAATVNPEAPVPCDGRSS